MVRLEREGDGRYLVFEATPAAARKRIGLVLGGNGKWIGETPYGNTFTANSARTAALRLHEAHLSHRLNSLR